jgi:hypothetical protein
MWAVAPVSVFKRKSASSCRGGEGAEALAFCANSMQYDEVDVGEDMSGHGRELDDGHGSSEREAKEFMLLECIMKQKGQNVVKGGAS